MYLQTVAAKEKDMLFNESLAPIIFDLVGVVTN